MKTTMKPLLLAGLLAFAGLASHAETAPSSTMGQGMHGSMQERVHSRMDPAKREARMAKHLAALKTQLKLTPAQEGAWTTFTAAMAPASGSEPKRPDPAEMDKLTTPERIDRMHAMQTQRMTQMSATMERHGAAIKTFYSELNAEQKKVFDTEHGKLMRRHGQREHKK